MKRKDIITTFMLVELEASHELTYSFVRKFPESKAIINDVINHFKRNSLNDEMTWLYENLKLSGKYASYYYFNDKPCEHTYYKNGELHGPYKSWYKNGRLEVDATYKNGKRHGAYKSLRENGIPYIKTTYKDGEEHGYYIQWHKDGKSYMEIMYIDGVEKGPGNITVVSDEVKGEA